LIILTADGKLTGFRVFVARSPVGVILSLEDLVMLLCEKFYFAAAAAAIESYELMNRSRSSSSSSDRLPLELVTSFSLRFLVALSTRIKPESPF
jgi:hypothetical protein